MCGKSLQAHMHTHAHTHSPALTHTYTSASTPTQLYTRLITIKREENPHLICLYLSPPLTPSHSFTPSLSSTPSHSLSPPLTRKHRRLPCHAALQPCRSHTPQAAGEGEPLVAEPIASEEGGREGGDGARGEEGPAAHAHRGKEASGDQWMQVLA